MCGTSVVVPLAILKIDSSRSGTAAPAFALQVQKKLSDQDKRLVQTSMLVGIAPELIGNTASEIMAISAGRDHFVVQGVLRSDVTLRCLMRACCWFSAESPSAMNRK